MIVVYLMFNVFVEYEMIVVCLMSQRRTNSANYIRDP